MSMPQILPVTSVDDPRVSDYLSVRERDLTGRDGKFIVEGKITLEVFLKRSRFEIESLFLEAGRVDVLKDWLALLPESVPVYTAEQAIMDQIAGFPIHRGILACGRKPTIERFSDWLDGQAEVTTLVMCVGLSNHDNAGAVFRNAAALGGGAVVLDAESCDPLYRKSIRVSAGTALWLPFFHGGEAGDLIGQIAAAGYHIWTLTPGEYALPLYNKLRPEKLCLVLGPEGPGLTPELIALGEAVTIPMVSNVDSLNVATSLAIALSVRLSGQSELGG